MIELLAASRAVHGPHITGHWQVVRMCLDSAAQEWLNVGIVFREQDGRAHWKLLKNLSGVRCLYDEDAADTVRFILDQAAYAFEVGAPIPAGWNVTLGPERFVRGRSADEILGGLFGRVVSLGRHQTDQADRVDREDHRHATVNVRATVRRLINEHLKLARNATPEFWRTRPLTTQRDGAALQVDLQIAASVGNTTLHGAVASAWYKTQYHRNASLSQAANAIAAACQAFPNSRNVLYLLQPPADSSALTEKEHTAIGTEIGTMRWLLERHGGELRIARAEESIAHDILIDLGQVAQMQ